MRPIVSLLLLVILMLGAVHAQSTETPEISVVVTRDKTGMLFRVNDMTVRHDLLSTLSKAIGARADQRCVLLIREDITLAVLNDTRGVMSKAGCPNPKTFVYDKDERWMQEITFGNTAPFSKRP